MRILDLTEEEVKDFIKNGVMRPENLRHYHICKAIADGMTQEDAAEKFGLYDSSNIRRIKSKKCPDCYNRIIG